MDDGNSYSGSLFTKAALLPTFISKRLGKTVGRLFYLAPFYYRQECGGSQKEERKSHRVGLIPFEPVRPLSLIPFAG